MERAETTSVDRTRLTAAIEQHGPSVIPGARGLFGAALCCGMLNHMLRVFAVASIAMVLSACASKPARSVEPAPIAAEESRAIPVFRGSDGTAVSYEELLAAACEAEVVIVGENHGHRVGNAWAATLFEDVLEKSKSGSDAANGADGTNRADPSRPIATGGWGDGPAAIRPALSMEFFERDDQSRLDDYLKGVVDEAAFRKSTSRAEGNYPAGHARMVEAAKKHGVPVIAANMPWQYVRFIRGKDYSVLEGLSPEQKRLFRIPDALVEGRYRTDHDELMGPMVDEELNAKKPPTHGTAAGEKNAANAETPALSDEEKAAKKKARLDGLFRVMQLWDWTMAESVADALVPDYTLLRNGMAIATPPCSFPIIHVVGRFHSDFTGGMPQALQLIRPGTKMVIISIVDQSSATLKDEDKGRGDFVVYVGEEGTGH